MMECPNCSTPVTKERMADGSSVFYCASCGWGKDRRAVPDSTWEKPQEPLPPPRSRSVPLRAWFKLALYWLVGSIVVLGPYAGLVYGGSEFAASLGLSFVTVSPEKMVESLNPYYWYAMGFYVLLAAAFSPKYDPENLGLFGSSWIDNPFSYEDDYNRTMRSLALLLLPGKFVWHALSSTLRVLWRLVAGR